MDGVAHSYAHPESTGQWIVDLRNNESRKWKQRAVGDDRPVQQESNVLIDVGQFSPMYAAIPNATKLSGCHSRFIGPNYPKSPCRINQPGPVPRLQYAS